MRLIVVYLFLLFGCVHLYYFVEGYNNNQNIAEKLRCTKIHQYTELEKKLFLEKSHQFGCRF